MRQFIVHCSKILLFSLSDLNIFAQQRLFCISLKLHLCDDTAETTVLQKEIGWTIPTINFFAINFGLITHLICFLLYLKQQTHIQTYKI